METDRLVIPGSKSITNRALLLAAAAKGTSVLVRPLVSADTSAFKTAIQALGANVSADGDNWVVEGLGQAPHLDADIWCEDAGTVARFLPPFVAAGQGKFTVDGSEQLRRRPLRPLVDGIRHLGARVSSEQLPLTIEASGLAGGEYEIEAHQSSQFASGLIMAAPYARQGLRVRIPNPVSQPYLTMTLRMMRDFGLETSTDGATVSVPPGRYTARRYEIEPDASTASYFAAASAVSGRSFEFQGLGTDSIQGDTSFFNVLGRLGAEVHWAPNSVTISGPERLNGDIEVDMGEISDTFMTLAAIAPLADGPITITNIGHARLKESDRISAMETNLRTLGVQTDVGHDWMRIYPSTPHGGRVNCHRDHRIAMAFSILGLRVDGITLDDPQCVGKTFPGFFDYLGRLFPEKALTLPG
ncbi:3-phosphoshikimate 1-carboxyvinyltransferase (plasmid) [Arthrobacter sp. UC242_113]|uniref:3-phosphoshikimate 1-carboxyvinyltransferase n=1 Tax=Arthrobacter sp. UC242_113 TaxID=3374550 RepID=UPI00015D894C